MPRLLPGVKRLLVGRPVATDRLGGPTLPTRRAFGAFGSNAISSVGYAPDEILLTLSLGGIAAQAYSLWVGLAVALVLLTVVASYRQVMFAYPRSGGDYEVVTANLGREAGAGAAAALLVDYALTVAVSVAATAQYLAVVVPAAEGYERLVAVVAIAGLALLHLRGAGATGALGVLGSGLVYLFLAAMGLLAVTGAVQALTGSLTPAASAGLELVGTSAFEQGLTGLGGAMLAARAFSLGASALTGLGWMPAAVPAFRPPKARRATAVLLALGLSSVALLLSTLWLASTVGVRYAEDPASQLLADGVPVGAEYVQHPVVAQVAEAVFQGAGLLFVVVVVLTGLILLLAANGGFMAFPVLGSLLARDALAPRQLHNRGDRLAFSNGIVVLAIGAAVLVWSFDASVTRLIQLYIVGAFGAFTLTQLAMVRHWTRALRTAIDAAERRRMNRSRAINAFGFGVSALVLGVVLLTRFTRGAWVTVALVALLWAGMRGISRYYARVEREVSPADGDPARTLPSRVTAIVLVSRPHQPTLRAIAYARATRPASIEAVTVGVSARSVAALRRRWEELGVPVPLTVLDSPYRDLTGPVLDYVLALRAAGPRDLVMVYIPEYVAGHWWEQLLHNQSARRLIARLSYIPGVVVASVPWQLESADDGTGSAWDRPVSPLRGEE